MSLTYHYVILLFNGVDITKTFLKAGRRRHDLDFELANEIN